VHRASNSPAAAHFDDVSLGLPAFVFFFFGERLGRPLGILIARIGRVLAKMTQGLARLRQMVFLADPDDPAAIFRLGMRGGGERLSFGVFWENLAGVLL
jgi:hypothetical protein